jgi:hypothetical protein
MELIRVNNKQPAAVEEVPLIQETSSAHFMAANTNVISLGIKRTTHDSRLC